MNAFPPERMHSNVSDGSASYQLSTSQGCLQSFSSLLLLHPGFCPFDRQAHSATSFKPTLQFGPLFKAVPIFGVAHTKARDFHFQLTIRLNLAKGKVYLWQAEQDPALLKTHYQGTIWGHRVVTKHTGDFQCQLTLGWVCPGKSKKLSGFCGKSAWIVIFQHTFLTHYRIVSFQRIFLRKIKNCLRSLDSSF